VVILTGLYVLMPIGRVKLSRAALGAVAATALWEGVRHILLWYFANVSMVNVLYGSLATTIVVLLTLEAAAVILLLGAQVIAELERGGVRPWSAEEVPPGTIPTRED
jgi:membrane protein